MKFADFEQETRSRFKPIRTSVSIPRELYEDYARIEAARRFGSKFSRFVSFLIARDRYEHGHNQQQTQTQ